MSDQQRQRLNQLLADRAVGSLDPSNGEELARLLQAFPDVSSEQIELAAAAADMAMLDQPSSMPDELRRVIHRDAAHFFKQQESKDAEIRHFPSDRVSKQAAPPAWLSWSGFLAAAVFLVFALVLWTRGPETPPVPSLDQQFQNLLAREDVNASPLQATDDRAAAEAGGQLIWSASAQQGFMKITGLAPNDRSQTQYQLWIFDENQDDRFPIDGGVFDIPAGVEEVIIPIDAKLTVATPHLYAITVEKPGGVVVSSRERIVLTAKPSS